MSRAADPMGPSTVASTASAAAPRRLCPFCGTVNEVENLACTRCGMEDTPATRQATRARIGPWHVLQSRNPAAPGMKFSTLISLVRKGQVSARSIVRGPTTGQFWTVATRVKGLSREFGVCHQCGGEIEKTANICPHCQKLQEPPINPDVLLESADGAGNLASPNSATARRTRPYVPEPTVNVDTDPVPAVQSAPRSRPGAQQPPGGILTARELATAFQLDFQPKPAAPKRKRRRWARALLVLIVLAGIVAAAGSYWRPDLRDQSVEWVRHYSDQLKARFERQWNRQPAEIREVPSAPSDGKTIDDLLTPPDALPNRQTAGDIETGSDDRKSGGVASTDLAEKASEKQPALPASPPVATPKPTTPVATPPTPVQPERGISEAEMLNQVRSLWRAAIDAEGDRDFAKAVRNYEQIRNLPRSVWPMDLDVRLNEARKHIR